MATNGTHLYYNVDWVNTLIPAEIVGTFVHEIMHCIMDHAGRLHGRNHELWNIAGDLVINPTVRNMSFVLPRIAIFEYEGIKGTDSKGKPRSTDVVYSDLEQAGVDPKSTPEFNFGEVLPIGTDAQGKPIDGIDPQRVKTDWEQQARAAAIQAKAAGKMPGELSDLIDAILESQVSWKNKLTRFSVVEHIKRSPNHFQRRWIEDEVYLPRKYNKRLGPVVFVCDSSGSINIDTHYKQFASEINHVLRTVRPTKIYFLSVDTEVRHDQVFTERDLPIKYIPYDGGGGTAFQPAFDWVEENLTTKPEYLIYLTDMDNYDTATDPGYPVLWVSVNQYAKAPFGEICYIS